MDPVTVGSHRDDDLRCIRNDGRRWRCRLMRSGGGRYCEKHRLQELQRRPIANRRARDRARARAAGAKTEEPASSGVRASDPPPNARKRRGRPPKANNAAGENRDARVSDAETRGEDEKAAGVRARVRAAGVKTEEPASAADPPPKAMKRPRGRPPKEKVAGGSLDARVSDPPPNLKKRPRGRPPTVKTAGARASDRPVDRMKRPFEEDTDEKEAGVLKLGQVWAFSEGSDGSPSRSYARIDRICGGPFVEVTPLVPRLTLQEEVLFAEKGVPLACGVFTASQSSLIKKASAFTHRVAFEKPDPYYRIFPKNGEVWAVRSKWDDLEGMCECAFVEIVSDFSEEEGVVVLGLGGVEGRDGVYRREVHEGFHLVRSFSRGFMPMFSHRVPASRIGDGGEILWELELH